MNALSGIYARVARARRAWYRPHRQRRLSRPVISVGNLSLGGSGKTPVVVAVVRMLQEMGERPSVLSRGYARRSGAPVVVVSRGEGPLVPVGEAGDEPFMLARALPGAAVIVGANRHQGGRWAEAHLDVSVHVLDDGFQHVALARDVDLLIVSDHDLDDRVLPGGRLREPIDAAAVADAVLVPRVGPEEPSRVRSRLQGRQIFELVSSTAPLVAIQPGASAAPPPRRIVAAAGIARPERFFRSLSAAGLEVADAVTFRDHHWFDAADLHRLEETAAASGATAVVTTAKDAVRLEPLLTARSAAPGAPLWWYQPYSVRIEPEDDFRAWLAGRLRSARQGLPNGPA